MERGIESRLSMLEDWFRELEKSQYETEVAVKELEERIDMLVKNCEESDGKE